MGKGVAPRMREKNVLKGQEPPYDLLKKHAKEMAYEDRMKEALKNASRGRGITDALLAEAEVQRLTNRLN